MTAHAIQQQLDALAREIVDNNVGAELKAQATQLVMGDGLREGHF